MSRKWLLCAMLVASLGMPSFSLAQNAATPPSAPATADNQSELAYRAGLGRAADIKLLIAQGANPNASNADGVPLLMIAAGRKDAEALAATQALIEGGADINSKDKMGQTALYYAAKNGNTELVKYLLDKGIDYYSLDNNGDIARTIAFRAGHENVVQAMDGFVKSQTLKINTLNTQAVQEQETLEKQTQAQQEANEAQARKDEARQRKQYRENLKKLDGMVYEVSYNACAFQYWSFVVDANQTIELSDKEVEETIAMHKKNVRRSSLEIMKMFDTNRAYVNQIVQPSQRAIYYQLNAMPSRTYRKEHGVGTLEDVRTRCDKIATNWDISEAKEGRKAAAAKKGRKAKAAAQAEEVDEGDGVEVDSAIDVGDDTETESDTSLEAPASAVAQSPMKQRKVKKAANSVNKRAVTKPRKKRVRKNQLYPGHVQKRQLGTSSIALQPKARRASRAQTTEIE